MARQKDRAQREVSGRGEGGRLRPRGRAGVPEAGAAGGGLSGGVQPGRGAGTAPRPASAMPILILGHTPPEMVPQLIAYNITQAVSAKAKAEEYSAAAVGVRRHAEGPHQGGHRHVPAGLSGAGASTLTAAWNAIAAVLRPAGTGGGGHLHPLCRLRRGRQRQYEAYTREQFDVFTRVLDALAAEGSTFRHPPLRQQRRSGPLSGDVSGHGAAGHRPVRRGRRCAAAGPAAGDEPEVQRLHHQDL